MIICSITFIIADRRLNRYTETVSYVWPRLLFGSNIYALTLYWANKKFTQN